MGYSNGNTLKVLKYPTLEYKRMQCSLCQSDYDLEHKFCPNDGNKLTEKSKSFEDKGIISTFLKAHPVCADLIDEDGSTNERFSTTIENYVKVFSKNYPDALFMVEIEWDQGFGAEPPSRYYIQGGKMQEVEITVTYEEFDPNKLQ